MGKKRGCKKRGMEGPSDAIAVRGFFRLQLVDPDGSVAGDSGWCHNLVTNDGFGNFIVRSLANSAGSTPSIGFMALGSGTAPATSATALDLELNGGTKRFAVTAATSSKTVQFTGTLASNTVTDTKVSNIGLFASTSGGTMFAGNTFSSSSLATNQAVNCTYSVVFATTT